MKKLFLLLFLASTASAQMWVTGYYPDWANVPRPANIDWKTMTHVIHFGITPSMNYQADSLTPSAHHFTFLNGRATFEDAKGNQNYPVQRQLIDTAHAHGRKVLLGYNGAAGAYVNWLNLYRQHPDSLKSFVSSSLAYARAKGYDGVDIDWEWPGSTEEGTIWNFFVRTIRDTLDTWSPKGTLTAAWFQWASRLSSNIDWNLMNTAMDQINIMCYDMEYSTRNVIHAPLYPTDCSLLGPGIGYGTKGDNVTELVNQYVIRGAKREKIGVGLPFYGYQHNGSATYCAPSGGGSQIQYFNIYPLYQGANSSRYTFDAVTQTPYLSWTDASGGHFISFDDSLSLSAKSSWGKRAGIGGLMIWEMDQDKNGFLMRGIANGLAGVSLPPDTIKPPPIDTVKPPPVAVCDTVGAYNKGFLAGKASVVCGVCPPYPDTNAIANRAYNAGKASVVCPPIVICPPYPDTSAIYKRGWNDALSQVPDSVDVPKKLPIVKPPKK